MQKKETVIVMCEKCLFTTDVDCCALADIYAMIDVRKRLVIEYRYEYDHKPSYNFEKRAIVDSLDTQQMAEYYKVSIEQLPNLLFDKCGVIYASTPSEAEGVFKEALDVILDAMVHYKLDEF